jgi:hypothetical protein
MSDASHTNRGFTYEDIGATVPEAKLIRRCSNCGRESGHQLRQRLEINPSWGNAFGNPRPPDEIWLEEQIWQCLTCDEPTVLFTRRIGGVDNPQSVSFTQGWPSPIGRELSPEVPNLIRVLYREASIAEANSALRAAAAMYRAAVEAITGDKRVTGRDLHAKIEALPLPSDLKQDLHEVRITGNWSLHEGLEFSADEVGDIAALVADAVAELYIEPARKEEARKAREARRRAAGQPPTQAP